MNVQPENGNILVMVTLYQGILTKDEQMGFVVILCSYRRKFLIKSDVSSWGTIDICRRVLILDNYINNKRLTELA